MRHKSLITKKAINQLVKEKETKTIIDLYEEEEKRNPFDQYTMVERFSNLNHIQKEAIKEMLIEGKTFGLSVILLCHLKQCLGLGSVTSSGELDNFTWYYQDYGCDTAIQITDCHGVAL